MRFYFDRNISIHLARMIAAFDRDNQIDHLDEDGRFNARTPDVELIDALTKDLPKPVLVTADVSQRRRPPERLALSRSGLTAVFLKSGFHDLTFHFQAVKIIWVWPSIVKACQTAKVPTIFEVPPALRSDKVERICATSDC